MSSSSNEVPRDVQGKRILEGDLLAKASRQGSSVFLHLRRVTKVEGSRVWVKPLEGPRSSGTSGPIGWELSDLTLTAILGKAPPL